MTIKFFRDTALEIVESFDDATEKASTVNETFLAGDPVQADIIDERDGLCQLEFGDGSQAFCVPRSSFEIIGPVE